MSWRAWLRRYREEDADSSLRALQGQFESFVALLERNHLVLRELGVLEQSAEKPFLVDLDDVRARVRTIRDGVSSIVESMLEIGGEPYRSLEERFRVLNAELEAALTGCVPTDGRRPIRYFEELDRDQICNVGSKNAQLGELRTRLGLPVPDGFAITASAYRHFMEESGLPGRVEACLATLDADSPDDLVRTSGEIQALVNESPVPADLENAIMEAFGKLRVRCDAERFAMRSSAIGEDSLLSFAGQYLSVLNVGETGIIDAYRSVIAGKYSPKALYYQLSHALRTADLPMSVGCVEMVDSVASGVIYTRDPVRPDDGSLVINAVLGLGKSLVDGAVTPDVFRLARKDGTLLESQVVTKPVRLVTLPEGGTVEQVVPAREQGLPSIDETMLRRLGRIALDVEQHYGTPQDIEWAVDRRGKLFLLQTRPLQTLHVRDDEPPDFSTLDVILRGGTTVCPGSGCGPVHHASSIHDLPDVPEGSILVAPHPFPGLVAALGRISGLVTEVGGIASHMATLAREYRIPTITGLPGCLDLEPGRPVTLCAARCAIYEGEHPDRVAAHRPVLDRIVDVETFGLLRRVLDILAPLHLLHPADPTFTVENCRSFHDVVRFSHQKALDEMFKGATTLEGKEEIGLRLRSEIPLDVRLIYLDRHRKGSWVPEDEIWSEPMAALWEGIREEGWPSRPSGQSFPALSSATGDQGRHDGPAFSESSYAFLGKEYVILGLRMGFHLSTIEAMITSEPSKNFIRLQHTDGGAAFDRKVRRVRLIERILSRLGFACSRQGDFLDARMSYLGRDAALKSLELLGRVTMLTKQLDMALSNDEIADWYALDLMQKLGLEEKGRATR